MYVMLCYDIEIPAHFALQKYHHLRMIELFADLNISMTYD